MPIPEVKPQAAYQDMLDYDTTRSKVFDGVLGALQTKYPVENENYRLELGDLRYDGPDKYSISEQKKAILGRQTLARPIKGTWNLIDKKTNTPIDQYKSTVVQVPYLTQRGTYIIGGNEYTVANQMRLKSGVYTRKKDNGEYEAHVNVLKGGPGFRVFMEPQSGVFRMQIGQAKLRLYPVMKAMGVSDQDMQKRWGTELFNANMTASDGKGTLDKVWERLADARSRKETGENVNRDFKALFNNLELDPEVTQRTLGERHERITPEAMGRITSKLINISKGAEETDDRDSLAYQETWSAPDLMHERIVKDAGRLGSRLLWRATLRKNLSGLPSSALNSQIESLFYKSGLAQPLEEINGLDSLDQNVRVTRLGEGGIGSDESVPEDARAVQPSHFNFIDSVRTPECFDEETEVMTWNGWKAWKDIRDTDELACLVNNQLEFHRPIKLIAEHYSGLMHGCKTEFLDYLVTPNHKLWVRGQDKPATVKKSGGLQKAHYPSYRFELAESVTTAAVRRHITGGHLPGETTESGMTQFTLPLVGVTGLQPKPIGFHSPPVGAHLINDVHPMSMLDWAEFMGWYLSEGSYSINKLTSHYRIRISQVKTVHSSHHDAIIDVCRRLGMNPTVDDKTITINRKQWVDYLKQFGDCYGKYIPDYIFKASLEAKWRFITSLLNGDGRSNKRGQKTQLCTTSLRLARDFERLLFLIGIPSRITFEPDERKPQYHGCYVVNMHLVNERISSRKYCYTKPYSGMVYCAEVPGHMLYTRRNGSVGFWSGNSGSVGIDTRLATDVYKGDDKQLHSRFTNIKTGQPEYLTPVQAIDSVVAFPGELRKAQAEGRTHVRAMKGGRMSYVHANQVNYEAPSAQGMFTYGSNLVPMASGMKPGRLLMAAKYSLQALPIKEGEAPLVQSADENGNSYYDTLAKHVGAVHSKAGGRVTSVTKDNITVANGDGQTETHELYNNFPMNRKTFLSNTPTVKPGDVVQPGQLLAQSNMTDAKGTMNMGRNLRVGYMPYGGGTYEDGIVVSESAARKLSSEHMYTERMDKEDFTDVGRNKFMSIFPATYNKNQLANIDQDGVVKPGTVVNKGDPLILSVKQRTAKGAGQLYHGGSPDWRDTSITWEHDFPGKVTDRWDDEDGSKVAVQAHAPCEEGDKLCYDDATEVLTLRGWVLFKDLTLTDAVASLASNGVLQYVPPVDLHKYQHSGRMYRLESQQLSFCVTPNHKQYVQRRNGKSFELLRADKVYGKRVSYKKDALWFGIDPEYVAFPSITVKAGQSGNGERVVPELRMPVKTYMTLLGAFLSEGNIVDQPDAGSYGIDICQLKSDNVDQLTSELDALGLKYNYQSSNGKFRLYGKQLMLHFSQFGHAADKFIPSSVFMYSRESLLVLLRWLMWGDGHQEAGKYISYHTTSKRLADDVQRLCLHVGYAANIAVQHSEGYQTIRGKQCWCQTCYRVSIILTKLTPTVNHSHVSTQTAQNEHWIDYTGNVWCCTLPVNHVMYVRRNGKPAWSGNSGRYGNKGVISKIVPDNLMPASADGKPMEILLSPSGIITRINPNQVVETVLGKIAAKRGQGYKLPTFSDKDWVDYAMEEAKKHGVSDTEDLYDPSIKRTVPKVLTGVQYFQKLSHTAESKGSGRGLGAYTSEGLPAADEEGNPKRIGLGEMQALISHGATNVVQEIKNIKGQRNDDYWRALTLGQTPPSPEVPAAYKKFTALLQGAGINIKKRGEHLHLTAMTDKDVDTMSHGELTVPTTVRWMTDYARGLKGEKSLDPVEGGLFDRGLTGGHGGSNWTHISLAEPMPQPAMEDPIKSLLGLTQKQYENILSGQGEFQGLGSGGKAIKAALERIQVDPEMDRQREIIKSAGGGAERDLAVKKLKYLQTLKTNEMSPADLVVTKVPVIPPIFRPVTANSKFEMVSGSNLLYMDLMNANKNYKDLSAIAGGEHAGQARLTVYNALKAVTGLGDPVKPERKQQNVQGLLHEVFGNSPKSGIFGRKLLGTSVDLAARAAVTPNSELDIDQIGIPEEQAWKLYGPFVTRRLIRQMGGRPEAMAAAIRMVVNKDKNAREALVKEMDARPVLSSRAPALHRYSIMAFKPVLTTGKTLQLSPGVTPGFNADFDGDTMNFHVLVTDKAIEEAKRKMLPSANIRAVNDFGPQYGPRHDFVTGLYHATTKRNGKSMLPVYQKVADALSAFKRGESSLDDVVSVKET